MLLRIALVISLVFQNTISLAETDFSRVEVATNPTATLPPPVEYQTEFQESDFNSKPWLKEFQVVVVVNKAESGKESQTARVYIDGKAVRLHEVIEAQTLLNSSEQDFKVARERELRIKELSSMIKNGDDTLFKVSTGRNAFEKKGEHHSQKDSWTVTPAGYYPIRYLSPRHKSESYSSAGCDSPIAKFFGAIFRKKLCTYMDHAMFFIGGVALHKAIPGTERALGKKASGGCVRMPGALAEYIFKKVLVSKNPKVTKIPDIKPDGTVVMNPQGQVQYTDRVPGSPKHYAYSALVIVQNKIVE